MGEEEEHTRFISFDLALTIVLIQHSVAAECWMEITGAAYFVLFNVFD